MYKLFIADDEPKIRKGLRRLVENFELDIEVCGEAADGMTATELIKSLQPDLILLDICMPIKSGLEIIRELKDELMSPKIIIISGHDEFNYVKEALEMNVFRYLLKPVLADELEDVLAEAIDEFDNEKESKQLFDWALNQLEKRRSFLIESMLLDMIKGNIVDVELEEQIKYYKIQMPENPEMILCSINQESTRFLTEGEYQVRKLSIMTIINQYIDASDSHVFCDDFSNVIGIFDSDKFSLKEKGSVLEKEILAIVHNNVMITVKNANDGLQKVYSELTDDNRSQSNIPIVETIKGYIEDEYQSEDLNLTVVSNRFKVSATYISRLLKQDTGLTFVEYVTQIRISNSIILMKNSHLSIMDIAYKVGFKTQHYYSTVFKKILGVAPSEYRHSFINEEV